MRTCFLILLTLLQTQTANAVLCQLGTRPFLRVRTECSPREREVFTGPVMVSPTGEVAGYYGGQGLMVLLDGTVIGVDLSSGQPTQSPPPAYSESPDCSPPLYMVPEDAAVPTGYVDGDVVYTAPKTGDPVTVRSFLDNVFHECATFPPIAITAGPPQTRSLPAGGSYRLRVQ